MEFQKLDQMKIQLARVPKYRVQKKVTCPKNTLEGERDMQTDKHRNILWYLQPPKDGAEQGQRPLTHTFWK